MIRHEFQVSFWVDFNGMGLTFDNHKMDIVNGHVGEYTN